MKKRIKIFQSGIYPQGNFSIEKVKNIFSKAKDNIEAIFVHSSKWKAENKEPVSVGKFSNFEIKENENSTEVYADINFNEKGEKYYQDGILKGVSVEITTDDKLDKIAVLPIGTNPAVKGAEFQEGDIAIFNFMEVEDMTREEVIKTLTKEELEKVNLKGFKIKIEEFEEPKPKTEKQLREEIRTEMLKEFEKEKEIEKSVKEFNEINKNKLTPAIKKVLTDDVLKTMFNNTLEFEKGNINVSKVLNDLFKNIPDLLHLGKFNVEFEDNKTKSVSQIIKENEEKTREKYKK